MPIKLRRDEATTMFESLTVEKLVLAATVLAVVARIAHALQQRRAKQEQPPPAPGGSKPRPVTEADRKLAAAMLEGMVAQVRHESDMEAARGHESVVARLVPQIPIRPGPPRSWLGGEPALPDAVAWPEIGGKPAVFLAQICCADLPADLWDALGPREGWLVFFIHPETYEMVVLHMPALGPTRAGHGPGQWFDPAGGMKYGKQGPLAKRAYPRWPVDVVAVRPGDPDPRVPSREAPMHGHYRNGYDLAAPSHHPFDWPSMLAMLDIVERVAIEKRDGIAKTPAFFTEKLARAKVLLAEAEAAPETPANLVRLRNNVEDLPRLIAAYDEANRLWDAAAPRVQEIARRARERATHGPFSSDAIVSVMAELHAIEWMHIHRGTDQSRGEGAEDIRCTVLPLTVHNAQASLWAHEFEQLRFDWAKHAYSRSADALPSAAKQFYETLWRGVAAREMAGMGHVPFNYVHKFDRESDITLIELPSSDLMSWMFGDVDNLVVTMKKADLAASDFTRLTVQVSN